MCRFAIRSKVLQEITMSTMLPRHSVNTGWKCTIARVMLGVSIAANLLGLFPIPMRLCNEGLGEALR